MLSLLRALQPSPHPALQGWAAVTQLQTTSVALLLPCALLHAQPAPLSAPLPAQPQCLQVEKKEAQLLKEAQPKAQLLFVEGMNHILKEVKTIEENQQSYLNPDIPTSPKLIEATVHFIKN